MPLLKFERDQRKNRSNVAKHKVSFEEAETAFKDENAMQYFDPDRSDDEDRFILLGLSLRRRLLVVCHCFREGELVIRIIYPALFTKREQCALRASTSARQNGPPLRVSPEQVRSTVSKSVSKQTLADKRFVIEIGDFMNNPGSARKSDRSESRVYREANR